MRNPLVEWDGYYWAKSTPNNLSDDDKHNLVCIEDLYRFSEERITGLFWWDELGRCYYRDGFCCEPAMRKIII